MRGALRRGVGGERCGARSVLLTDAVRSTVRCGAPCMMQCWTFTLFRVPFSVVDLDLVMGHSWTRLVPFTTFLVSVACPMSNS